LTVSRLLGVAALSLTLALTACSTDDPGDAAAEAPHGFVAGAEEVAEAATALAYATDGGRQLHLLDLAGTEEKRIDLTTPARELTEDGRFLYVSDGDRTLEIVDSGVWTTDHTDHVHYYRAPAKSLGTLTLAAPIHTVAGHGAHTAISTADGRAVVLDRKALENGQITELLHIDGADLAVPYADHLLAVRNDQLVALNASGRETGAFQAPCENPGGWVVLRGGAVIACTNHWVRVKHADGRLEATAIPGRRHSPTPGDFGSRPRSNEAAMADSRGVWSLNAPRATAQFVRAAGVETAASPADGNLVLTLDKAGTLRSLDVGSGRVVAEKKQLGSLLTVDVNRAYVTDPATGVISEIDYRDRLRTARTLTTTARPDLAVEVGR
jgi:hypothetical protein